MESEQFYFSYSVVPCPLCLYVHIRTVFTSFKEDDLFSSSLGIVNMKDDELHLCMRTLNCSQPLNRGCFE